MMQRLYSGAGVSLLGDDALTSKPPDAFLSYTRFDDQHSGGAISEIRHLLSNEVRAVSGKAFEIFQDVDGIGLGESWGDKLDQVLHQAWFFIPIITPNYFSSKACREELEKFLREEARRGRDDLVLPIYYIKSDILENENLRAGDPLAQLIHERQRQDWRDLRFEQFDSEKARQRLEHLAREIARACERPMVHVIQDDDLTPELVVLPRGNFMMGSPDDDSLSYDDEKPRHRVKINYRIAVGRSPVTFEEWDHYAKDAAWHRSRHVEPYKPSDEGWQGRKHPVINVSWDDVQRYLRWLSDKTNHLYRLLSEAEWEYACRAGRDTAYNIGSGITHSDANYGKNVGKTVKVGNYPPNAWGLHDMHGNVWEWVEDCWHGYETPGRPDDGSAWTNGDCRVRVLRGGAWYNFPRDLRSACRFKISCEHRLSYIGFRVARTIP